MPSLLKRYAFIILLITTSALLIVLLTRSFFGKASVASHKDYQLLKTFVLNEKPVIEPLRVNFQDDKTVPPPGWMKDTGEPFSAHTGVFQGSQLMYGWKSSGSHTPLDLTGNGRSRTEPEDVLLSTFVHMQADDISMRYGAFDGVKANGYWELKILNGVYKVAVAVGDATGKAEEVDCINVEGVKTITDFRPIGKMRSPGRFKSAVVTVTVEDGYLTIDAKGGKNTKICYAEVTPVTIMPYIYALASNQNLVINKGESFQTHNLNLKLNNSANESLTYDISISYNDDVGKKWLSLAERPTAGDSVLRVNYGAAAKLPVGIYSARINVKSRGFTTGSIDIQLRVIDDTKPYVISSTPVNGSRVGENFTIAANNLFLPATKGFKGGIDNSTINNRTVKLIKIANGNATAVSGSVQGTGGGDAVSFTPSRPLEANTSYKFVITDGVKTYSGLRMIRYESNFSTLSEPVDSSKIINASFTKISLPGTQNKKYTSLVFGPDDRFYALKMDGSIERYDVDHKTGMLSNMHLISTLVKKRGQSTAIGLTFDPVSKSQNLVAWVSYSSAGFNAAPMFDGRISRLSGPELGNEQQVIVNLPRSTRDHMVNSMAFGPDGALYISVGSNSSAGLYDKGWQRDETLLAGAILRLDLKKLRGYPLPLDVKTTNNKSAINQASTTSAKLRDGSYNPYSTNSPLTIYASGIRNAYDMVWHSNGQLYVPANGSGGGGNSPASINGTRRPDNTFYIGPDVPATENVPVQHDWLFRINPNRAVGYYGHPNPLRGEYVINRGHADNPGYSANIKPDPNYRGAAFDFGFNKSPNGVIEYKGNAFNGVLKGKLLVCRFSGGGDIMVLEPGSMKKLALRLDQNDSVYDIIKGASGSGNYGLHGMVGFANPLDLVEDIKTGNLYISEFNWNENPNLTSQITLLKVDDQRKDQHLAKNLLKQK